MNGKPSYSELFEMVNELREKVGLLESKLEENERKTERLKSRFLSSISHELRTPMNAILGFSNLMVDKNLAHDKKMEYMEHINNNSNSLLNIVDTMIDVSLLEVQELKIKKEKFNLDKIMQQVYYYFNIDKHKIGKEHIALLLNRQNKNSDNFIYSDPLRLTQILSSLLNNALKFTNKGIIEFGYELRNDGRAEFYVKDSGKGILAQKAQSIFDKFEKLDEDFGSNEGGVGLGLTLAKGLTDLLGGKIWIESNIFNGSTFCFTIEITEKQTDGKEKSEVEKINDIRKSFQTILV